ELLLLVGVGNWLGRFLIHFRFGQDERRLAGAQKLQLLADLHFLLALAVSQTIDTLPQPLVLGRGGGVPLLQIANLTMFFDESLNPLRTSHGNPRIACDENSDDERGSPTTRSSPLSRGSRGVYQGTIAQHYFWL